MCQSCGTPKAPNLLTQTLNKGLEWYDNAQRIRYATITANAPTEIQEIIAKIRLETCTKCENMQVSDLVNVANDLLLSDEVAEKLEPHLKKQCGLCGCSCVLLAYDQLVNSKPCKVGKF
jgi:hypothetical protein